ncbi:ABC transporter substrate-binding protein [Alkalihalobacillus sp. 1P02AB]|uniref:ABC transporter substrate-binding protein n=1 Tax=Alkalihalobacillus sp. 1P02AB TaxID=3132260 RepID=UPI0039A5CB8A
MKAFKKGFLLIVVLLLSMTFLLAACNSDAANSSEIELTWLVRSDPAVSKWYDEMVEGFEAENPHIKVNLQLVPQDEIDQRLTTMIASRNVPDVWSPNWSNSGFATYNNMDALLDLTEFLERDPKVLEGIPENIADIYNVDGGTYGIPMSNTTSLLFYNKDLFDEAGVEYPPIDWDDTSWDWDAMVEKAKQLTKDIGDPNNQVFGVINEQPPTRSAWVFGGDFFSEESYETGKIDELKILSDPNNKKSIQAIYDLIYEHKVSPNPSQLDAVSQIGNPFMTGRVAMNIGGGWGFRNYIEADFRWGVAAIPFGPDGTREIPVYADPWTISKDSKHPEESWELIKYLTNPEYGGKRYAEIAMSYPANLDIADVWYDATTSLAEISKEELSEAYEGSVRYGRPTDNHLIEGFSVILNTINQTMDSIYSGNIEIDKGLETIEQNLRALD